MSTFQDKLKKYAELIVKVGVNIQQNQKLMINSTIESAELTRLIVKRAYEVGAGEVIVNWSDDQITRYTYELAPDDYFKTFPKWRKEMMETYAEEGAALISVVSSSPALLKGVDAQRISDNRKASGEALAKFRSYIQSDKISWCVVSAPSKDWATMVFPNEESEEVAVEKLWDAIFKAVRADLDNPVKAWEDHDKKLHEKVDYLNEKRYKKLHYRAPGTDLTIELPDGHLWVGAGSTNAENVQFMANMPTEEVFTVPYKKGVNGTVRSTKPLSYGGNVIDNFTITFKDGRITEYQAEQSEEILKGLIETDEGSHYLGEIALVPHDSPISNSNILFFNTLFDENASNHLAIGNAYAFCIEGGKEMDEIELEANGLNKSIVHEDFMIGSAEMDIDGIKEDGTTEPIFRSGNWAF
ncbi:peptidase M29 [Bacillus coahuilensis p1.1.43]|uniref:Peptidase M29 n=1 Tax=Bacillus coahuilensis p1.1.43 TaxID=1150625 RepID=A0A147KC15_9BACI|nr:aminopeptidase [Bacillus coahuilensis]KUP09092.1 peptidase M29 [Bacillus coahuilensis p1.1.43]